MTDDQLADKVELRRGRRGRTIEQLMILEEIKRRSVKPPGTYRVVVI